MNKETVMVRIDKGLRQILKMEAARRGQSMEELLNMLLRKSLKYVISTNNSESIGK